MTDYTCTERIKLIIVKYKTWNAAKMFFSDTVISMGADQRVFGKLSVKK